MKEQEKYTEILKRIIVKTENDSIQTSEQLIQALISEISGSKESSHAFFEPHHS